jgi:phenylalanyl-tRNA synthetase beta chain
MEYSLQTLNENSNLKCLTTTEIIDQLNLIGFEVDETYNESFILNKFIDNLRLLIKIPANREDLLAERFLLTELSTIFLFEVNYIWKKIKQNYYSILRSKYLEFSNYESNIIESTLLSQTIINQNEVSNFHIFSIEIEMNLDFSTPLWIKNKLSNAGLKNTNTIHDLIMLNNLEWGQNINYLSAKLKMVNLTIKKLDQKLIYIDSKNIEYTLTPGTVVIVNSEDKIESVLGIFNQIENIRDNQNKIILQSIFYDIHENVSLLNPLENKISLRYLRSISLKSFRTSFERILTLLELTLAAKIIPFVYSTKKTNQKLRPYRKLVLQKTLLKSTLNIESIDLSIFKQAGLLISQETTTDLTFLISSQRNDLRREIDIVEEYSRFVGYINFEPITPKKVTKYLIDKRQSVNLIKQLLLSSGFQEVVTNPLREFTKRKKNSVCIKNPLNNEFRLLRVDLLEKIVPVFETNLRLRNKTNNCFEIGRIFEKTNNGKFEEHENLAGIFQLGQIKKSTRPTTEWFIAKGFIENIFLHFGYEHLTFEKYSDNDSFFHPTKSVTIKYNNVIIGFFGETNPNLEYFKNLKFSTYIFEVSMEYFIKSRTVSTIPLFQDFSKYPVIIKDLSFLMPRNENFYSLKSTIKNTSSFLKKVEFFDIYFDEKYVDLINVGIRLDFQRAEESFTTTFIEKELTVIKNILIKKFKAEFRS